MPYELKLFSGNANRALAEEIGEVLGVPLGQAEVARFSLPRVGATQPRRLVTCCSDPNRPGATCRQTPHGDRTS